VIARIGQIQRGLGGVQLLLQGEQRATALQYSTTDGHLQAVVIPAEEMLPLDEKDPAFEALHKETRERAAELGERRGLPRRSCTRCSTRSPRPGKFSDLVAGYIDLTVPEKQGLLETLASRSGCAACSCTCSGRSGCSRRRRTSRAPCRRSWASASARCSSASR
jgi:ATP-dependent Lon protease